jgi:hypothetical protein
MGVSRGSGTACATNGGILAETYYTASENSYSTSSSTFADVDATNLTISFTAPCSGKVLVRLISYAESSTAGTGQYKWRLYDGSNQIGNIQMATKTETGTSIEAYVYKTGLSAGASYTWKWQHAQTASGTGKAIVGNGSTYGAMVMIAEAVE